MSEIVKRQVSGDSLHTAWKKSRLREKGEPSKFACVVRGLPGCGKTTFVLDHFKDKKVFYFSFAGLEETFAERLFAERVVAETKVAATTWADAIKTIIKEFSVILLDDIDSLSTYKRFQKAFYDHAYGTRTFVVLIARPMDDVSRLADKYNEVRLDCFSIHETMKLYPKLSKFDACALNVISDGLPRLMDEYDTELSFTQNLQRILESSGTFVRHAPEFLSGIFRRPENYHRILHAIANDKHSISEIGKFTGFAYNKCDNYLAGLVSCGIVMTKQVTSTRGAQKTAYIIPNSYFRLWYKYVFANQTEIQLRDQSTIERIVQAIARQEIHTFHAQKAFAFVNSYIRGREAWFRFDYSKEIIHAPVTVTDGEFSYTFDAIEKSGDKAVYIKVFESADESCTKPELERLRRAVSLTHTYYDSQIYIFTKRRFSDYAVKQAAMDWALRLIEVNRL